MTEETPTQNDPRFDTRDRPKRFDTRAWLEVTKPDALKETEHFKMLDGLCKAAGCTGGWSCEVLVDRLASHLHAAGWGGGWGADEAVYLLAIADREKMQCPFCSGLGGSCNSMASTPVACETCAGTGVVASDRSKPPPGYEVFVWPHEKASDPPTSWCAALRNKQHFASFVEADHDEEGEAESRAIAAAWAHHDAQRKGNER